MTLRCIAIDDEPLALDLIKNYAERLSRLQLVQCFDDAISAGEFLRDNSIDILFIDINMPDISGLDLVRSLKEKPLVIFTTAYKKFAVEGFELEAVDYLLKPIDFERFKKAVSKALEMYRLRNSRAEEDLSSIFVRSEYKMVKILLKDIQYIEALEDYIKIYIADSKPILTLGTLKSFIKKLPADQFQRIHRSYIVPLSKIASIVNKKISLDSGTELPVSESYIGAINEWVKTNK